MDLDLPCISRSRSFCMKSSKRTESAAGSLFNARATATAAFSPVFSPRPGQKWCDMAASPTRQIDAKSGPGSIQKV
eukprot:CAMPEP_0170617014 /NCGR_PEP_ID=MMETSP0224-20130122/26181_1 /TAXON_ID=285029 /ORGANISM="Togula jolla, Strain CCCM 725" /LENGTH=75 /DNA_ID=CAMNT_0010942857 /DNA_START=844 /DNA_END=1071 /DNA_ORIENTATION=+